MRISARYLVVMALVFGVLVETIKAEYSVFIPIPPKEVPTKKVPVAKLKQEDWLEQFHLFFKEDFCSKKDFLMTCLKIAPSECRMLEPETVARCSKETGLPAEVSEGAESEAWGAKIGRCVAKKFEKKANIKKVDPKCFDIKNW